MIVVIDASVVVKWFVAEPRHELAATLLNEDILRIAPELVVTEAGNALQKKVRASEIGAQQAEVAVREIGDYFGRLFPIQELISDAFDLSLKLSHPLMDCEYLALARHTGAPLVSDDEKFIKKCRAAGFEGMVVDLKDWPTSVPLVAFTSAIDAEITQKLSRLSAQYQQAREHLKREWFNPKVALLAEKKLEAEISALDCEAVAHLIAACWLGALDWWERDKARLQSNWERHLANARASIASEPEKHLVYIVSKLHNLEQGLSVLTYLASDES